MIARLDQISHVSTYAHRLSVSFIETLPSFMRRMRATVETASYPGKFLHLFLIHMWESIRSGLLGIYLLPDLSTHLMYHEHVRQRSIPVTSLISASLVYGTLSYFKGSFLSCLICISINAHASLLDRRQSDQCITVGPKMIEISDVRF